MVIFHRIYGLVVTQFPFGLHRWCVSLQLRLHLPQDPAPKAANRGNHGHVRPCPSDIIYYIYYIYAILYEGLHVGYLGASEVSQDHSTVLWVLWGAQTSKNYDFPRFRQFPSDPGAPNSHTPRYSPKTPPIAVTPPKVATNWDPKKAQICKDHGAITIGPV